MAKNTLDDFIYRLTSQNIEEKIASALKPKMEIWFKDSVSNAIADFYDSYTPRHYERTGNFASIANNTRTFNFGNTLEMIVPSDSMHPYKSWFGNWIYKKYGVNGKNELKWANNVLNVDTAFDYFFMQGRHGGSANMGVYIEDLGYNIGEFEPEYSTPPNELIEKDINNSIKEKAEKEIVKILGDILG